ncbi:hypothetical protein [Bradyrhizobium sp. NC92]|uniref:hypothetical protein n=1 Tax=Bradyrhizobium sp. (strain NC92) TaxID=55395 RepID=UPI0021A9DAB6|nr:hypothetical protein [Bradyrhizobium sp. NC92]UWU67270.1 hypothetical protein N2602_29090 [Bradyrhizobium sp. NC92]
MLLKKNAQLLRMPTVLLSASKICQENTCRSTLLEARVAPSPRADVVRTVAHLTAAMFANRKLGWIEGSQIDGEEFETARAPPDIATKCVHVIRNPRLPMPSRERRRKINSRKTDSARSEGVTSTSDNRSTADKLREKIWSGIPLPIVIGAWPVTPWQY